MQNKELGEERDLMLKIAVGDQQAFRLIFDAYKNKVFSYANRYLKSKERAEEVVQETFLKIWLKRENLNTIENFGGYIRRIAVNLTLDLLRAIAAENKTSDLQKVEWSEQDTGTEDAIMRKDAQSYVDQLLAKLPKQQGLVYRMCHIEGMKQKEVAEILHIAPATVKVHLREALKTLRTMVGENNTIPLISFVFLGLLK
ncbi:RNA polymerase sigma factor [Pedobacter sp. R-06]|mgnify:CR=1 FL=1|uniref:RNA polymerase sigma factor n=1 Tax=Pedobacter sp. R-06 TaxID=3404051 RepID=UPI003CEB029E